MNPNSGNFNLQAGSQCRLSGDNGQDLGACFYDDIPEAPDAFSIIPGGQGNEALLSWLTPGETVHGNLLDSVVAVQVWRNDSLISTLGPVTPGTLQNFTDVVPRGDWYRYQLCALDAQGAAGRMLPASEIWLGGTVQGFVIWELDKTPISGAALRAALVANGADESEIYFTRTASRYALEPAVKAVFVCLGVTNNNHVLSDEEGTRLADYLVTGGNVYMEGGDTWWPDPQTTIHYYCQVMSVSNGSSDLFVVDGEAGTPYQGMQFAYTGENLSMDHIEPMSSYSHRILVNPGTGEGVGVASDWGAYHVVSASFEMGGLVEGPFPSTRNELVNQILLFFDVSPTGLPDNGSISRTPDRFVVMQNYPNPFNGSTHLRFRLPSAGRALLQIFDLTGREVIRHSAQITGAGWREFLWDGLLKTGEPAASGAYLFRLSFSPAVEGGKFTRSGKMYLQK